MSVVTCENIHKELINYITRDDSLIYISNTFNDLKTDYDRVAEAYCLLYNFGLLPNFNGTNAKRKNSNASEKYRNDGNRAFVKKDDMSAMYYYTRAIGYAIIDSKEISIAFANRSAVTFSLGDFSDAVKDIDRALDGDYPDHLKFKLWERKGKSFLELGNLCGAKAAFEESILWLEKSQLNEEKKEIASEQLTILLQQCILNNSKPEQTFTKRSVLPELTHGQNPNLQSGSDVIEVEFTPDMGRHLVAKVDINPGDILAIERPYSSISLPNSYFFFCYYCHQRCHSLIPCQHCSMVFFCDTKCHDDCWEESHSIECNILPLLLELGCDKLELLSLRVLINATKKGKNLISLANSLIELESSDKPNRKGFIHDQYYSDSYKAIHNLEGNTHLKSVSYLFARSVFAACILHILDTNTSFFNADLEKIISLETNCSVLEVDRVFAGGLILKYLQSMASNAHEISEMRVILCDETKTESVEIGSAAYSLLSLINHSCDPNVVRHSYNGSTVVLTALKAIKKGEQIFDNYGFHHATHIKSERHSHLKSQYMFNCECIACKDDWPLYVHLPNKNPIYYPQVDVTIVEKSSKMFRDILLNIISNRKHEKIGEWISFLYSHLKLLQNSIIRPWKEFSECQEVIKQCLSLQANHYFFKSSPLSLTTLRDNDIRTSPF